MVDAATLTGAMVVALGHVRAGVFSNDEDIAATRCSAAAEAAGEQLWPMPMDDEYDDSDPQRDRRREADRRARGAARSRRRRCSATSSDDTPWAHLDIAGVNSRRSRDAEGEKGATGFGVRTFVELADAAGQRAEGRSLACTHHRVCPLPCALTVGRPYSSPHLPVAIRRGGGSAPPAHSQLSPVDPRRIVRVCPRLPPRPIRRVQSMVREALAAIRMRWLQCR